MIVPSCSDNEQFSYAICHIPCHLHHRVSEPRRDTITVETTNNLNMSSVQSIISNYHFLSTVSVSGGTPHGQLFYDCTGQQAPHDPTSYWNNGKFLRESTEDSARSWVSMCRRAAERGKQPFLAKEMRKSLIESDKKQKTLTLVLFSRFHALVTLS